MFSFRQRTFMLSLLFVLMFLPQGVAAQSGEQPVARAIMFYSPTCPHCRDVLDNVLPPLRATYGSQFEIQLINLAEPDGYEVFAALHERYPNLPGGVPQVYIGRNLLLGSDEVRQRLPEQIEACLSQGGCDWSFTVESPSAAPATVTESMSERFAGLNVLAVATAGLLDGINPCAFTTIIFFVSYLALVGRGKQDVLLVGAAFTLAVFLTYLALGLGLSAVVERIGSIAVIGRVIYAGTALVCIVLAALSLWDYVKIRRGQMTEIALQLPSILKKRIHQTIRTHSRMRGYVAAAFGAGILVSIFELACTGQMYLPTIVFMTSVPEMRPSAIAYLILYNALFVAPLIAVFGVTYYGVSSQRLTAVFQANAAAVKLFTAALFGVLGGWLAYLLV